MDIGSRTPPSRLQPGATLARPRSASSPESDKHVRDGFLDISTSLATGAVAAVAVGTALRRSRVETDERTVPLAGLTCAFVFAAQMINFPVGLGTSGHLMGGALAAVLVGPWTGMLCLSVVLLVQALLSLGQRRRVAVATVLAMEPELLVLDEPTSNLDPAGRRALIELLDGLDLTLLVITHDLPFALELCERSVVMSSGTVAADGGTLALLSDDALLSRHALELPLGMDPAAAVRARAQRSRSVR